MGILNGKVAVVTGGTRGLGLEMARALARNGAAVVAGSRSQESVDQATQIIRAEVEGPAVFAPMSQTW